MKTMRTAAALLAALAALLLYRQYADPHKARALKEALTWGLRQGQPIAEEMGYIPLPENIVAKATEALAGID